MLFPCCPFSLGLPADKRKVCVISQCNPQGGGSRLGGRAIEKKVLLALARRRGAVSQPFLHGTRQHSPFGTMQESGSGLLFGHCLAPFPWTLGGSCSEMMQILLSAL